ncbi:MAG: gliding motility protein GldL [Prevotella sp.]|nr:gliding motility protein GldL [Prevotella sp.]
MAQYSKYNIVYRLQKWMDSVPGQTFLNYAYSWGAAVVILGTLFKLTHIKGADFWLFLGMGTEVFVFFLSAFDRPFDKTADGMDLPTHLNIEDSGVVTGDDVVEEQPAVAAAAQTSVQGGGIGGGTIIIGGGGGAAATSGEESTIQPAAAVAGGGSVEGGTFVTAAGGTISVPPLVAAQGVSPEDMVEATNNYVEELKKLTEVLERVAEQSRRLTTDSEEMENLNRTLTGICKIYEMQLKTASQQMGTGDDINAQMKKMAGQIEELNRIYTRMIEAMTVNMPISGKPATD